MEIIDIEQGGRQKMNKERIYIVAIVALILLLVGAFAIPKYNEGVYENGFIDGQVDVARIQTETGNIFIINNQTVESYPLGTLCQGYNG